MSGLKSSFSSNLAKDTTIGTGIALVAPLVSPTLTKAATPVKKAALRFGNVIYEKLLETSAAFSEIVDDAIAETQAETQTETAQESSPGSQKNTASVISISGRRPEKRS